MSHPSRTGRNADGGSFQAVRSQPSEKTIPELRPSANQSELFAPGFDPSTVAVRTFHVTRSLRCLLEGFERGYQKVFVRMDKVAVRKESPAEYRPLEHVWRPISMRDDVVRKQGWAHVYDVA